MNVESLTLAAIEAYDPRPIRRGKRLRAKCPIHGSDHQQSLSVDTETGWGRCFSCGVTVRVQDFIPPGEKPEERWRVEGVATVPKTRPPSTPPPVPHPGHETLAHSAEHLAGSPGETYLSHRGIPLAVAQRYGVGFVGKGSWPGRKGARRWPRLTFRLATPEGVVNWYSRAASFEAPRSEAHDVLSGPKGYFHFDSLRRNQTVFVVEAPLDGLSLAASGWGNFVALIGIEHFRPGWFLGAGVREIVLGLDRDEAGRKGTEQIAWQAMEVGLACRILPEVAFAGEKDLNAALIKRGGIEIPPAFWGDLAGSPGATLLPLPAPGPLPEPGDRVAALVESWRAEWEENPHYPEGPDFSDSGPGREEGNGVPGAKGGPGEPPSRESSWGG